ncbi:transposase domain-containing protein [Butyrivibrio fibrisolvens]|uniref:transposase domain-containing protein n=1 Tax=Butyrivibrio fibrisolvens TaxID=831 RepID=UPI00094534F9|nr:transposase domain-containing protein [Butyrivibrio fibrisolvens]
MESDNGAKASAMIFSIAETAKANAINTYEYFNLLLSEIPKHQDDKDTKYLDALLPWSKNVQDKCPSRFKKSLIFNVHIYVSKSLHQCGDF